ncbi:3-oxoacyl-ACP reductase [Sulfolobales archaeon HS-7]|nr:3-oxoacyl-ACP reductase [Sulfolobales archaeon HS-7]
MNLLRNKHIVITGGTHGIGLAFAKRALEEGANVTVIGRSVPQISVDYIVADLSKREEIRRVYLQLREMNIDALINNASRNSRYSVLEVSEEEWNSMIELNLTAPMFLSKAAAEAMIRNGNRGKIINVSAIQAFSPLRSSLPYAVTKGGLISMARSMAVDLGQYGIQVITVLPGPIYTKGDDVPENLDLRSATLLGRMGRPEEVANLLVFLSSDMNTFITGTEIIIDGGRLISRKPDPDEISRGEV